MIKKTSNQINIYKLRLLAYLQFCGFILYKLNQCIVICGIFKDISNSFTLYRLNNNQYYILTTLINILTLHILKLVKFILWHPILFFFCP